MALISEKKLAYNPSFGSGSNETILLNKRIEFKSEKEYEDDSDEDGTMSCQKLKTKYNVLVPESTKYDFISSNKLAKVNKNKDNDGDDLGEPKYMLYPREKIVLNWKKMSKIGPGLYNLGNTCFMNSVLQCLSYCPPLVNFLISNREKHSDECDQKLFCMICLMTRHITVVFNRPAASISPKYIQARMRSICKHFVCGRQEDAHEFLRYLIDHMWRSCLTIHEHEYGISGTNSKFDNLSKATTAINHIFGGYCRSQVVCSICRAKSNTYDYIMDLMLDVQNVSSLEEALQKFVTPELLKNENAYKCGKCKRAVTAQKQFTVFRAPNVATFQFKRFDCGRMFVKVTKVVTYPEYFNLRPYMSEKGPPMRYKLISVLVHLGPSCNSGHYYCYVRNSNDCWYLMDDSNVCQVSLTDVLNQKAYVLMYILDSKVKPSESVPENVRVNHGGDFNPNFRFTPNKSPPNASLIPKSLGVATAKVENKIPNGTAIKSIVPYDGDDSDEDSRSENGDKPQVSSKGPLPESDLAKPSSSETVKEAIPVLKMKVVVPPNSWEVVKPPEQSKVVIEKQTAANSEWLVSKNPDSSRTNSSRENSSCNSRSPERERRKKDKKDKRRRRKKEKKRKTRDSDDSDRSERDSGKLTWIERGTDSEKRKLNDIDHRYYETSPAKKPKLEDDGNSKKQDVLDILLKNRSHGYGENVKSWNGGVSTLNKISADDRKSSSLEEDQYNDEFDQGKVKRSKPKHYKNDMFRSDFSRSNPFQVEHWNQWNKYGSARGHDNSKYRPTHYMKNKKPFKPYHRSSDGYHKDKYNHHYDKSNGHFSNYHGSHQRSNNFHKSYHNYKGR